MEWPFRVLQPKVNEEKFHDGLHLGMESQILSKVKNACCGLPQPVRLGGHPCMEVTQQGESEAKQV